MAYTAVSIEKFPGLNLWEDPGDDRGAIDAQNVTMESGRIRTRFGFSNFYAPAGNATRFLMEYPRTGSGAAPHLIAGTAGTTGNVYAITYLGTLVASSTMTTIPSSGVSGQNIGTTAASYMYLAADGAAVKRWDGTTWTAPAGFPANTKILSLSPTDNRLVAISSLNKVSFSGAGIPETWGANDFVYLTPGDGEEIRGAAVFNNQLFVFKWSKFFVFYGTSDNPSAPGTPLFNYRAVATGVGMGVDAPQTVVTGADGVYFIGPDGIYRTTGGPPVKISQAIDPFFTGVGQSPFWTGGTWANPAVPGSTTRPSSRLAWVDGRLYCALFIGSGSTTSIMMVWDSRIDAWTKWGSGATGAEWDAVAAYHNPENVTLMAANTTNILNLDSAATVDYNAQAIVSKYRLPFEHYGSPGEKRLREVILEGVGSPTLQLSRDWGALGTGGAVTLGTSPAVATGRRREALRGRAFSLQFGASSGAWSLNRAQVNLDPAIRPAGVTV